MMYERTMEAVSCARLSGLESAASITTFIRCRSEPISVAWRIPRSVSGRSLSSYRESEEASPCRRKKICIVVLPEFLETTCANRKSREIALLWFCQIVLLNFCVQRFETDAKNCAAVFLFQPTVFSTPAIWNFSISCIETALPICGLPAVKAGSLKRPVRLPIGEQYLRHRYDCLYIKYWRARWHF